MSYRFQLVDVFDSGPLSGNPLAVVTQADDLSSETMLAITRWLNFSETAFLLTPTTAAADYRVRIFTPDREMPFAGHPTLGSCHTWLSEGGKPRDPTTIVQECGAGLVPLKKSHDRLAFSAPPLLRSGPVDPAIKQEVADFLRVAPERMVDVQWADNGPGWILVRLATAAEVLALEPARTHPRRIDIGVVGPHAAGAEAAFELRAFFTDHLGTVREDPVTGSLNASAAQTLLAAGIAHTPYIATQGARLGRAGRIFVDTDSDNQLWIGGHTTTLFSGECFTH